MQSLDNFTPFAAACIPSLSRADEQLAVVIVAADFELPRPGSAALGEARVAKRQRPVRIVDEYRGDPASSSLRHEGQSAYVRPGTDIYIDGLAWTPRGRLARESVVGVRVGPFEKHALVFGERVWTRGAFGPTPSKPQPFSCLPLAYERCFGGSPHTAYNPVGCGSYGDAREALGAPLPNFEDPKALIQRLGDSPRPVGFGPVARHWLPRRAFAGTYDQAWLERRVPLWPADFDERFFCAAAAGLCAVPHLVGGETVELVGLSPDGDFAFELPRLHLRARFELPGGSVHRTLVLDAISFEPEAGSFTMIWRAHVVADVLGLGAVIVRLLDGWEVAA